MLVYADRVKETTTTTGTGTLSLGGAASGFRTFVAGCGDGAWTPYALLDANGAWEVGYGRVVDGSPDTLTRALVTSSSNSNAAITLSSGTHTVFVTAPAEAIVSRDRYFPLVTVLVPGIGSNGSTTIPEVINDLAVTVAGNAQLDTAQSPFGGSSIKLDGSGDGVRFAIGDTAHDVSSGDFTAECFVMVSSSVSANGIIMNRGAGTGQYPYQFRYVHSDGKLYIESFNASGSQIASFATAAAITKGVWYHMAICRRYQTLSGFVGQLGSTGDRIGTGTVTVNMQSSTTAYLNIGSYDTNAFSLLGWVAYAKITKGFARYRGATYDVPKLPPHS